jgi:LPXTG-motif cell wall-anchored protein
LEPVRAVRFVMIMALLLACAAIAGLGPSGPAGAAPGDDPTYSVTVAARGCSEYTDIMANLARNNIQESLRDLGKDSVYQSGQPIDPTIEEPNHPACHPLNNWQFTFGNNGGGPKVQNLSQIGGQNAVSGATRTVPLLDTQGQPTGQTIEGATTLQLSADQVALAQSHNLWIQGGLVGNPLMYNTAANRSRTQGFGALRCAIDNLNGDNVEWIGFPGDSLHVFCYFYTVDPAPTAGTIVVEKRTTGAANTHTFNFQGNVSYNPGGAFALTVAPGGSASESFVRGATDPEDPDTRWNFTELDDPEYEPTGPPACTSSQGTSTTAVDGQSVTVDLAADDTVTCVYTDQPSPTGPLELLKQSSRGVGTFGFVVTEPDGTTNDYSATTTRVDTPVEVAAAPNGGPPGTWTATETMPPDTGGTWSLERVECNGDTVPHQGLTASTQVAVGEAKSCVFYNSFTPDGSITITKDTHGGVGSFHYVVRQPESQTASGDGEVGTQDATTVEAGTPVTATGDPLTGLDVYSTFENVTTPGRLYSITELLPPQTADGTWQLTSVDCGANQVLRSLPTGHVIVRLTPANPHAVCAFVNTFVPVATVSVEKAVHGDTAARTGPVDITLVCGDQTATLRAPAGSDGPFQLTDPVVLRTFPAECTATETANGAGSGVTVRTTHVVSTDGTLGAATEGTKVTVAPTSGQQLVVRFDDTYTAATPTSEPPTSEPPTSETSTSEPPTSGSSSPAPTPAASTSASSLAQTGNDTAALLGVAGALVLSGAGLVILGARRRSRRGH